MLIMDGADLAMILKGAWPFVMSWSSNCARPTTKGDLPSSHDGSGGLRRADSLRSDACIARWRHRSLGRHEHRAFAFAPHRHRVFKGLALL